MEVTHLWLLSPRMKFPPLASLHSLKMKNYWWLAGNPSEFLSNPFETTNQWMKQWLLLWQHLRHQEPPTESKTSPLKVPGSVWTKILVRKISILFWLPWRFILMECFHTSNSSNRSNQISEYSCSGRTGCCPSIYLPNLLSVYGWELVQWKSSDSKVHYK